MKFEIKEDAYNLYNSFGGIMSFSFRKHNAIKEKTFVCSKEGQHGPNKRNKMVKCHLGETKN